MCRNHLSLCLSTVILSLLGLNCSASEARNVSLTLVAEKSFGFLAKHCDTSTFKCKLPRNTSIAEVLPEELQTVLKRQLLRGSAANRTLSPNPFLSPHMPTDWERYLPENWKEEVGIREAEGRSFVISSMLMMCEGDLMKIGCSSKPRNVSIEEQEAINKKVRWTFGTVPFVIDEAITDERLRSTILEAMFQISNSTCVTFVEANLAIHSDHVVFTKGLQFASDVGRGFRRRVIVKDATVNERTLGEILHVLMHVLGFGHEHNREDRDQYLWINNANIKPEHVQDLFNENRQYALIKAPYDYESITHHGFNKFALNESVPTLLPKLPGFRIGQRQKLSVMDIYKINTLYGCYVANAKDPRINSTIGKRNFHDGVVVEDSRIRFGTMAPLATTTTTTAAPPSTSTFTSTQPSTTIADVPITCPTAPAVTCPACECTCPTTPLTTTITSTTPAPTTTTAATNQFFGMPGQNGFVNPLFRNPFGAVQQPMMQNNMPFSTTNFLAPQTQTGFGAPQQSFMSPGGMMMPQVPGGLMRPQMANQFGGLAGINPMTVPNLGMQNLNQVPMFGAG